MGIIRQLTSEQIAKIAAGEVIERPASIVKELVENSIDAGATQVDINLIDYGLTSITVTDNGCGMSRDDLLLSYKLHTTSKLSDFNKINSLGFRGEALASIAAVTQMSIKSRIKSEPFGANILIGPDAKIEDIGMSVGTEVSITQIFAKTPARKKYLKGKHTELKHIVEILSSLAFANLDVGIRLKNDDHEVFQVQKSDNLIERAAIILGETFASELVPIEYESGYISIKGLIGRPQVTSTSSRKLYFSLSKRPFNSSIMSLAVKDAYGSLISPHEYPVGILDISLPLERIDVNIHPRKETIQFLEDTLVYETVKTGVLETLKGANLTFYNISWKKSETRSPIATELKETVVPREKEERHKPFIQIHNMYLVGESSDGLLILDQHAAHERVLFDKFSAEYKKAAKKKKQVQLSKSLVITLGSAEVEHYLEHKDFFEKAGFDIDEFGDGKIKVNATPYIVEGRNIEKFIKGILDDFATNPVPKDIDRQTYLLLSYLACRSAIKANEVLSNEQIESIISELGKLDLAYTCPHGRPLKIELALPHLSRLFKRTK